ncbi:hypothetical protein OUZ56_029111 [Daphnia magna]|nr:hypothetical protein OUZ56_029111 [Daphnia magna]
MSPDMTRMGDCFVTSSDLLMAHQDVLRKLQSKQSPVEELLKQADQLIATQRPRAEVYAAMAESLGQAWKDLNSFLEQRRVILEYNVAFHSHAEDVIDKLASLDRETASTSSLPSDVDSIKRLRTRIEESRKSALESLRLALQDGEVLIEKLTALKNLGTLDSRPGHILTAVNAALNQVRRWLEALHDRRRRSESTFLQRRAALDQWSEVCCLRRDLAATEKRLEVLGRDSSSALGDSSATAELLLFEHNKIQPERKELQEKTLKLTHMAEELQARWRNELGGANGAEQVRKEAYALLDKTSEFLETVEQREQLLAQSIHFFRVAGTALTKLDQLEVQLTAHQAPPGSAQLAQLHAQVSRALEDATAPALHHGYSLLDIVGRSHPGAEGIRKTVELIENRGIQLGSLCTAHKEESLRITQAVRSFIEQYENLQSWLLDVIEGFLRTHTDMRGTLPEARDILDMHIQLFNDLKMKSTEIESLLRSVNPLCEMAEEIQAHEVQMKGDVLHDTWKRLCRALADRVELMQSYVRLHALAMAVQEAWDDVESRCQQFDVDEDPSVAIRQVEEIWLDGQQKYLQLSQLGRNFMTDALKISDRYLDVRKACLCVESLLEYLGGRQLTVHHTQETWIETVTTIQHTRREWNNFVSIVQSVMEIHEEKEQSLYPMLPTAEDSSHGIAVQHPTCTAMVGLLEEKSKNVVNEWTATLSQLESKKLDAEQTKLSSTANQEDRSKMLGDVCLLQQRMQFRLKEYKTLVQMALGLFRNLSEVERTIEVVERKSHQHNTTSEVDQAIKDHQVTRNTIAEMIKITKQEADQFISLLRDQEPPGIAQPDVNLVEYYLMKAEDDWRKSWQTEENRLARQRQRCQFNNDLHTINVQLDDLSKQLAAMRGQYGSSLAAAKVTSQAFFQFEKTVELLEVRVETFVSTDKKMIAEDDEDRANLEVEVSQMNRKWSSFHREVGETRQQINLSIDYFTLVEEVEQSFRSGSQMLVTAARKSTQVKTPEEATTLLKEVDGFIKPQEAQLERKITKISQMAIQLYGHESSDRIQPVLQENRNMLDSFSVMNAELTTLATNLKAAEDRFKQAETQAAVQESLDAARAEAASARAAASAAEEARKAAEAAALAMKETQSPPPRPPLPASIPELPRPSAAALSSGRAPTPPKRAKPVEMPIDEPIFTTLLQDATVEESKAVQLTCRVTGQPTPSILWLKDGMAIANNPDYQTKFDERDGTCCLTIDETFADDSARFTCQASNVAGIAETTAFLRVQECAEDVLLPPEFVESLIDSTAREGQPHQLSCRVVGIPVPLISWYKNGICVDYCRDYNISFNDGLCTLSFSQVFVEDGAMFECRAANEAGDADTAAHLTVEPLEPTEVPAFKPGLSSNVMARTGQKVRLECVISAGLPKPSVLWLHNNKPVKETRDIKTLVEGNRHLLTITEAFPKDAGTYTVVARNPAGEAITTCNLAVKGRVPTETSDSELASDMEPIKPGIQQSLPAKMNVREGDKVRMDCVIVAQPEPEVIWYHKDRPVKESSDFQLIFQGDRCSLIIREAFQEDAGLYRVVAVNSAGEASSQCHLTVSPIEEKLHDEGTNSSVTLASLTAQPDPTTEPPVFKKTFGNVAVDEGGPLILDCTITGRPTPHVQWHFNDQPITASGFGFKTTKIGENQYRLSVDMARPEHGGRYKCVAESQSGVATCVADATVQPRKQDDSFVNRRAVFSQSSTVVSSQESSYRSVTRQVQQSITQVTGQAAQQMATERTEVIEKEGDDEPVMSVKQRASLFAGTEAATPKASPVQVVKKTQRKDVAPRFVTALTGVMVEPGANIQLEGILDGHPIPDVKWYKNGVELVPPEEQDRLDVSSGGQKVRLSIKQMEESDAGRYTCTARNSAGTASSTADVVVRRTQFPPVFGRRLQAQTVRSGSRVTMEVEVTGTPPPEVSWSRDDRLLSSNNDGRISTKVEGTRHWIVISKVSELDAGRYTVRAMNRAGEAISTAELFVSAALVVEEPSSRKHPPLKVDVTAKPADLLPEPPPEVLYAPKSETPKSSSSGTRVDFAEKTRLLEEASKIVSPTEVPGRIRLLPMPSDSESSPPRIIRPTPPPELPPRQPSVELSKFEPFPQLEPFPFKPDPPRPEKKKPAAVPAVRKPGKFVRGESRESDYESDLEGARITPRWVPPGSDTDDTASYKKVKPKLASDGERTSRAVSKEPTPPTQFEVPAEMEGPPRPKVLPLEPEVVPPKQEEQQSQLIAAPGTQTWPRIKSPKPPSAEGLAMEKSWVPKRVESDSKTLPRLSVSPVGHLKPSPKALEMEKQWSHRFTSHNSKIWPPPPSEQEPPSIPIWTGHSSTQQTSTVIERTDQRFESVTKKSILKTATTGPTVIDQPSRHVTIQGEDEVVFAKVASVIPSEPTALKSQSPQTSKKFEPFPQLEPFPFEANPPGPAVDAKKCGAPPVRKPGKFVQGQFMESDYESHLDSSRIPSRWLPAGSDTEETSSFKKIQLPKLSTDKPAERKQGKCPSPPSKYDVNPPQYVGPPRPEFKKPSPPVQTEFKLPTPPNQPESKLPTQPEGSPRKPSITGTETVQRMQMEESTRFSKRFVTVEQTTRTVQLHPADVVRPAPAVVPAVIKRPVEQPLEPFPFVPDPPQPRKAYSPLSVVKPSKFIPAGCSRESDYESDYDGAKIRPRWTPAGSDAEYEPAYRKVQPPSSAASANKKPTTGARTPTPPSVFDQPPSFQGPPRPVISPTDVIKIKSALDKSEERPIVLVKPKAIRLPAPPITAQTGKVLQPAEEPVYCYAEPPPTAAAAQEKAASHFVQMSDAFRTKAQHFAQQVISDVKATSVIPPEVTAAEQPVEANPTVEQQPAVETTGNEPQAYHEESRQSEFGTKHIDPDTGLIYFKYDFGYEFGLVLPGEPQKVDKIETSIGKEGTIELPVLHEQTVTPTPPANNPSSTPTVATGEIPKQPAKKEMPNFKPKKFTQYKAAKWEPTDSELSDQESGKVPSCYYDERKQTYSKFQPPERSLSPQSLASSSPRDSISGPQKLPE